MSSRSLLVFPFLLAVAIAQRPYGDPTPGAAGFKPRLHAGSSWIGNMNFGFDIAAASGGVPDTVIIQSYERKIVVDLAPGGMITTDDFYHAASGA